MAPTVGDSGHRRRQSERRPYHRQDPGKPQQDPEADPSADPFAQHRGGEQGHEDRGGGTQRRRVAQRDVAGGQGVERGDSRDGPEYARRQALGRSVMTMEVPRYRARASAMRAPMRNRAAPISGQGRSRAPSRVHTFMPAKHTWARTIQRKAVSGKDGKGGKDEKDRGAGMKGDIGLKN